MTRNLNFPEFPIRTIAKDGRELVFDVVRKKWVVLTPEEWVRQHILWYMIEEKLVPSSLIAVEKALIINTLSKRFDALVYDKNTSPVLLIECKAPSVKLSQSTLEQAARYNLKFKVGLLLITNGLSHYCIAIDHKTEAFKLLPEIPSFLEMIPPSQA